MCGMLCYFFFSSRRRHTRSKRDWSSDVCSSDLNIGRLPVIRDGKLVGIITRTNIIEKMHELALMEESGKDQPLKTNMKNDLKEQLEHDAFSLLEKIRQTAEKAKIDVYLVGCNVSEIF